MGIEDTRRAVEALVKKRGNRAQEVWNLVRHGLLPPEASVGTLRITAPYLKSQFRMEAEELIRDIENVLRNPPIP